MLSKNLNECPQDAQNTLAKFATEAAELFKQGHYCRALLELDRAHAVAHLLAQSLNAHDTPERAVAVVEKALSDASGTYSGLRLLNKYYSDNPAYPLASNQYDVLR